MVPNSNQEKRKIMFKILLPVFAGMFALSSCVSGGISRVEDLEDSQFESLLNYAQVGIRIGSEQLLKRTDVPSSLLTQVSAAVRSAVEDDAPEAVGNILSDIVQEILDQQDFALPRSAILAVVRLIEHRVQFQGVIGDDGRFILSERSRAIMLAISDGINQALELRGVLSDSVGYEDVKAAAWSEPVIVSNGYIR